MYQNVASQGHKKLVSVPECVVASKQPVTQKLFRSQQIHAPECSELRPKILFSVPECVAGSQQHTNYPQSGIQCKMYKSVW